MQVTPDRLVASVLVVCVAALSLPAAARAASPGGYEDFLDWEGWARVVPGARPGLASSFDRFGGPNDANWYESPAGLIQWTTPTVARTITGPGVLERFWMPHASANAAFALRLYFDGETTPRIDTTTEALLGGGVSYFDAPLVATCAGGQVCYDPIPFRESVRIETENRAGLWHWYHWNYRTFAPGTDIVSYTGTLDAQEIAARAAVVAMFENVGQHPAGPSGSALVTSTGPAAIPPGEALVVADLVGPGLVRRLNVRMDGATDAELDSLALRVTYDAAPDAAIDVPVGWFFGAGNGRVLYKSIPVGTDSPDGFYCYWPMPFRLGIRVELLNRSASAIDVDDAIVEFESKEIGDDLASLRVAAKRTLVASGQNTFLAASAVGAGHYVGNLLYIRQHQDEHYFLEGDERIVVDGTTTLWGTGIEDAYNGGFYYNWVPNPQIEPEGPSPAFAVRPLSGILKVERTASPPFGRADQFRWQIADRVPFSTSFALTFETFYCWPGCEWVSVVFWYQLPPAETEAPEFGASGAAGEKAGRLSLAPVAPNPVGGATTIRFTLPRAGDATVELVDVAGRRVRILATGPRVAGPHEVQWNRADTASGVYFVKVTAHGETASRKVTLVK